MIGHKLRHKLHRMTMLEAWSISLCEVEFEDDPKKDRCDDCECCKFRHKDPSEGVVV